MDWSEVRRRKQGLLLRLVLALIAAAGLAPGQQAVSGPIPRSLHGSLVWLLCKVESSLRRLIVIEAEGVEVTLGPERSASRGGKGKESSKGARDTPAKTPRPPGFPLTDPKKRFGRKPRQSVPEWAMPRCSSFDEPRAPYVPKPVISPDDPVSAVSLQRRLEAVLAALHDLPAEALRLARWRARQARKAAKGDPFVRQRALRMGMPPGYCRRSVHPIDNILKELQSLAHYRARARDPCFI